MSMPSINNVMLLGHIGGVPEYRDLPNGIKMVKFSLATNKNRKDRDGNWQSETQWHNIVGWGYSAEKLQRANVGKGDLLLIEGSIQYGSWVDNNDVKHYRTDIVINRVHTFNNHSGTTKTANAPDTSPVPSDEPPF